MCRRLSATRQPQTATAKQLNSNHSFGIFKYTPEQLHSPSTMRTMLRLEHFGLTVCWGSGTIGIHPLRPIARFILRRKCSTKMYGA